LEVHFITDGFVDQNDVHRKSFGTTLFENLLSVCATLPVEEQKQKMEQELDNYMQDQPQRDDITIVGIRL
jgi:serine phosphatase RsbU (regulator of sigma subunit)